MRCTVFDRNVEWYYGRRDFLLEPDSEVPPEVIKWISDLLHMTVYRCANLRDHYQHLVIGGSNAWADARRRHPSSRQVARDSDGR